MALITRFLAALRRDEDGQGLAEYALILALIAIVAIIALIFLGTQVSEHPQHRGRFRLGTTQREPAPPTQRAGERRPARRQEAPRLVRGTC